MDTIEELRLKPIAGKPLLLEAAQNMKTMDWVQENKPFINKFIAQNGALLIRGLKFPGSNIFGKVLECLFDGPLLEYVYRSTPRTQMRGRVYTATEYPANEVIPQHNENAYSDSWPNRIGFLCLIPAESGGATPISDSREIYNKLTPAVREKFEKLGVMYVRNYCDLDLPWSEVFQTDNRSDVEQYCLRHGMTFEWLDNNGLRTKQVNPAVINHPVSGEKVWFNQAHLFSVHNLQDAVKETLMASLGEDMLPRNTFYGDGTPIEESVIKDICALYDSTKIRFDWQKNDLLLLDNVLFTHGRESYSGPRKVITGMACPNR